MKQRTRWAAALVVASAALSLAGCKAGSNDAESVPDAVYADNSAQISALLKAGHRLRLSPAFVNDQGGYDPSALLQVTTAGDWGLSKHILLDVDPKASPDDLTVTTDGGSRLMISLPMQRPVARDFDGMQDDPAWDSPGHDGFGIGKFPAFRMVAPDDIKGMLPVKLAPAKGHQLDSYVIPTLASLEVGQKAVVRARDLMLVGSGAEAALKQQSSVTVWVDLSASRLGTVDAPVGDEPRLQVTRTSTKTYTGCFKPGLFGDEDVLSPDDLNRSDAPRVRLAPSTAAGCVNFPAMQK
jgi:hypothetical protein